MVMSRKISEIKDYLHAQICFQLFITPLHFMLEKKYRDFSQNACEYIATKRTECLHFDSPRHYVVHHFIPTCSNGNKILVAHGWMSRAAYMCKYIDSLVNQGFEVFAVDFPAHGESKGRQLVWTEAVTILKQIMNDLGPMYGVIGHSFGGSMVLNALNLSRQFPQWRIKYEPEKVILLASPTRMRTPVKRLARQLHLSARAYLHLKDLFKTEPQVNLNLLNLSNFTKNAKIPFLCIHGKEDDAIHPFESEYFYKNYPHSSLVLLSGVNHINILFDERVDQAIKAFLTLDEGIYLS